MKIYFAIAGLVSSRLKVRLGTITTNEAFIGNSVEVFKSVKGIKIRNLYDGLEIWNLIDMNRYLDYRHCILLFGKQSNPGLGRLSRSFSGTSHEEPHRANS